MAGRVDDRLAGTLDELRPLLPDDLFRLLTVRDGAAALAERLPTCFNPAAIGLLAAGAHTTPARRAWELVGFYYLGQSRYYELYVTHLQGRRGDKEGKTLELLA